MSRLILLLLALGLLWVGIRTARNLRQALPEREKARARFFIAAEPMLDDRIERTEPSGFPRLAGRYRGHAFDLQAVPDSLSVRKLPTLWVMVTLTEPQDLAGEAHVMARGTGQESFSRFGQMAYDFGTPPGFPPGCQMRCSDPGAIPPPEMLELIAPLFRDPRVKEVVLSPKGLRLVVLAEEAERTAYLLYREAELGTRPFPADRLGQMLDDLITLHRPARALP